jgi:hypothetical protein
LLPEEVQTFKELYSAVKSDYKLDKTFNDNASENSGYRISQVIILSFGMACFFSVSEKANEYINDVINAREEEIILPIDPNDPFLRTEKKLNFPEFDR